MFTCSLASSIQSHESLELRAKASALNDQARPTPSRTATDAQPARARSSRARTDATARAQAEHATAEAQAAQQALVVGAGVAAMLRPEVRRLVLLL